MTCAHVQRCRTVTQADGKGDDVALWVAFGHRPMNMLCTPYAQGINKHTWIQQQYAMPTWGTPRHPEVGGIDVRCLYRILSKESSCERWLATCRYALVALLEASTVRMGILAFTGTCQRIVAFSTKRLMSSGGPTGFGFSYNIALHNSCALRETTIWT